MNGLPVISRELLSEARHPMSYWLRCVCVLFMGGLLGAAVADEQGAIVGKGSQLFGVIQPTLFTLICLVVPIMTCDAISRERREGTLGLLLMTPLRPKDVAIAKALSGILRASTLVLSTIPILVIPVLSGGLSALDVLRGLMMDGMALVAVLAAGLLASSCCRQFHRAAALSIVLSLVALLVLGEMQAVYLAITWELGLAPGMAPRTLEPEILLGILSMGPWLLCSGVSTLWQQSPCTTTTGVLWLSVAQLLIALCFLRWVVGVVDRRLPKHLVEVGLSARQARWWRRFLTPVLFRRPGRLSSRLLLERNPSGWFQRRSWEAQLASRSWAIGLAAVELVLALFTLYSDWMSSNDFLECQPYIALLLGIAASFSAVNSFRQELETGALELLLVSRLSVTEIVRGRIFGLWRQYVSSLLVLLISVALIAFLDSRSDRLGYLLVQFLISAIPIYLGAFLALPIIGLHQSIQRSPFILRWLLTLGLGLLLPLVIPAAVVWSAELAARTSNGMYAIWGDEKMVLAFTMAVLGIQGGVAWVSARNLVRCLTQRSFMTVSES